MKCWGCRKKLKDGGAWFFTDAPAGKKIGLCEPCHEASAPSKSRREWRMIGRRPRFSGGAYEKRALVNDKPLDL